MTVLLTIKGTQRVDGDADTVTQELRGFLERIDGGWRLAYTDDGVPTLLQIALSQVTLSRAGGAPMTWEVGKRHLCEYQTPYGALPLGITTENVIVSLDADGGKVALEYTLDQNGQPISANSLEILVAVPEKG